ncbi:breast cancer type 2 susceptibility protein homolog [Drosophila erecta]|uniref:Breast cancer type 2 susceptibility protein homolog n=1 Tax=Drosophila erecta TaxID=7220 RepID=B3NQL5_DROER|nr:breast cancer type 2 susceptibility protein homolog [Drosophila erecta]EDV57018.2 uncharacterized protein Dere_GG22975 [Drosophila erecta]
MDQKSASGSRSNRLSQGKDTHARERATLEVAENRRSNIIDDMAKIHEADRQTSAATRRAQGLERLTVDNSGFVAVEDLILACAEPTPEEQVEMIMLDFCSSPTYAEDEDEPSCETEPWFRFRKKRIRTYGRKRDPKGNMVEGRSSSGLSVQRDLNTSFTSVACDLDAASSQRIHEVLLNLSQYFSMSATDSSPTPSVPSQIDLPTEARRDFEKPSNSEEHRTNLSDTNLEDECMNTEVMNLRDDLLENGFTFEASIYDNEQEVPGPLADTLFGDSRQAISITHLQLERGECKVWSDADSAPKKAEMKSQAEHPVYENTNLILEGIPISEWLTPMELPEKHKEVIKHIPEKKLKLEPSSQKEHERSNHSNETKFRAAPKKESDIANALFNDGELLNEFLFNEWNPIQCSDVPSTSKDAIEVPTKKTEQQPEKKTPNKSQPLGSHQLVGFRKTPFKFIEVSEEMKIKGEQFVDKVVSSLYRSSQKCNSVTEKYSANHGQVMESTECVGYKTALSKPIDVLDGSNKEAGHVIAKFEVGEIIAKCSPLNKESITESEFSGFRTASNKAILISEKMKMKTAEFMAEFQSAESNQQNGYEVNQPNGISTFVGPSTALNKTIETSDEMQSKATKLVVDVKMGEPHQPTHYPQCPDSNESTFFGFRTASNKAIENTEAMEKRGAMFLAQSNATDQQDQLNDAEFVFSEWQPSDLPDVPSQSNDINLAPNNKRNSISVEKNNTVDTKAAPDSEFFGFRTASNKGIVISESTKIKAAQFMSEFKAVGPSTDSNKPIVIPEESKYSPAQLMGEEAAEDSPNKPPFCDVQTKETTSANEHFHHLSVDRCAKEEHPRTPKRSQEIHSSLSQLAGLSPLDQATKKSVIERRNILSLKRKRKITSSTETSATCASPAEERFAPTPAAASTPLAARDLNLSKECTKDRQHPEDMSPICMQPRRSRRLGLSRSRY